MKRLKGQVTLEYLTVALIALSLISISMFTLFKIKESAEKAYYLELFRGTVNDFFNAAEETCAQGSGAQKFTCPKINITLDTLEKEINFYYGNVTITRIIKCSAENKKQIFSGCATISNRDGIIFFE